MELHALVLQDAPPAQESGGLRDILINLAPIFVIFILFFFLLIRPQRRQQKEREAMLATLKKNDHVVTSGGIIGIVDKIKEGEIVLKVDEKDDVRIRVLRSSIVDIRKVSGAAEEDKKAAPEQVEKK